MSLVAVFDLDQTLCDTSSLEPLRAARDWAGCRDQGAALPFRPGISNALQTLLDDGATIGVATSSPGEAYARPFLRRLAVPFDFVMDFFAARDLPKPPGVGRRAAIKAAQLAEICRRKASDVVVFVGDDRDDAEGARIAGVPFVHACFAGPCAGIDGTHVTEPADLPAAIERVGDSL